MADKHGEEPSYIDYETFLDPSFSATSFANSLVLATNNPSDTPLDLSTPLSRVLFDVQEIDTHIDSLTTKSALPLLSYTKDRSEAAEKILDEVEGQVKSLSESYRVLEREVLERYDAADQVRLVAERLCETVRLGRAVGRCLMLGRQLEAQIGEVNGVAGKKGDIRAMVRCANSLLSLRQLFAANEPGEEGHGLEKVHVITTLRKDLVQPAERNMIAKAQQVVREFSMSSLLAGTQTSGTATSAFQQAEETRSRATSGLLTLYLLSPTTKTTTAKTFEPKLLIAALQDYLQTAIKSSLASLARSLATLPTLDRTLLEISSRCQNLVALEALLESIKPPPHPLFQSPSDDGVAPNFLEPLLTSLDTASLPSYFWRTLASNLPPRVQEILNRGGVSARTLRTNKDQVRDKLRKCVDQGSQLPNGVNLGKGKIVSWEREAAVMVGAITGVLGR
ncbi:uncharacterized protein PV09_05890 [Verruconis gallopava]|uniref:Conserved oligomeric Golgi complex subunit 5 n=1 Tax=Verruconis gallopava TaxID=253628 RepID=A0A0D2A7T7_9PEZI|nr:uncharacterized protein PV09_05890 [Verruconis gallopava]KIW02833.1 hypothetical protein PV09_05890 [Verruconis gallopava]